MKKNQDTESKWEKFKQSHDIDDAMDAVEDETDTTAEQQEDVQSAAQKELGHPDYQALEEQLTTAEQKAHEHWEKLVRMSAELDNVRRRADRDVEQALRFGVEKLITALLPVLDSLEQALQLVNQSEHPAMHEGIALTMKVFLDVLAKQEVQQLDPINETFNPQEHEAISMVDAPDKAPHTIISVFQKGYRLKDRIIRPARVIITKG